MEASSLAIFSVSRSFLCWYSCLRTRKTTGFVEGLFSLVSISSVVSLQFSRIAMATSYSF